jgi:hypothetical protein
MKLKHTTMGEWYWQGILNYFQQTCPSDNTIKPSRTDLELNVDLQGEIKMTHCLSRDRSSVFYPSFKIILNVD